MVRIRLVRGEVKGDVRGHLGSALMRLWWHPLKKNGCKTCPLKAYRCKNRQFCLDKMND